MILQKIKTIFNHGITGKSNGNSRQYCVVCLHLVALLCIFCTALYLKLFHERLYISQGLNNHTTMCCKTGKNNSFVNQIRQTSSLGSTSICLDVGRRIKKLVNFKQIQSNKKWNNPHIADHFPRGKSTSCSFLNYTVYNNECNITVSNKCLLST